MNIGNETPVKPSREVLTETMKGGTSVTVGVTDSPPSYARIVTKTLDVLVTLKSKNPGHPTNGLNFYVQAIAPLMAPVGGLLGPSYSAALKLNAPRAASAGATATFATPLRAGAGSEV